MALSIDKKVEPEQIVQFASQLAYVPQGARAWLEETFNGEHSREFYEGLLAAYSNMHVMVHGVPPEQLRDYSGAIVAFVANHLKNLNNPNNPE